MGKTKDQLAVEHERATDGRKAHRRSTAPSGLEEHMNEEQMKRLMVEKQASDTPETKSAGGLKFNVTAVSGTEDVARTFDSAYLAAAEAKALRAGSHEDVVISDEHGREYSLAEFERLFL